jgi:hypothetical protein
MFKANIPPSLIVSVRMAVSNLDGTSATEAQADKK